MMAIEICEGCKDLDLDTNHNCRADSAFCVDGAKCPDFIGEGNCGCKQCLPVVEENEEWIVDGKEQHHAPDANKYNAENDYGRSKDGWFRIDSAKGNTMNRLDWQNIAITSKPPKNED